jgi:hypothetical protein
MAQEIARGRPSSARSDTADVATARHPAAPSTPPDASSETVYFPDPAAWKGSEIVCSRPGLPDETMRALVRESIARPWDPPSEDGCTTVSGLMRTLRLSNVNVVFMRRIPNAAHASPVTLPPDRHTKSIAEVLDATLRPLGLRYEVREGLTVIDLAEGPSSR